MYSSTSFMLISGKHYCKFRLLWISKLYYDVTEGVIKLKTGLLQVKIRITLQFWQLGTTDKTNTTGSLNLSRGFLKKSFGHL